MANHWLRIVRLLVKIIVRGSSRVDQYMEKDMNKIVLVVAASMLTTTVQAATIDNFVLDMNGTASIAGVESNVVLDPGKAYIITISGTFEIGCEVGGCPTDAEYYVPIAGGNAGLPFDLTGFDDPAGIDIGAQINGDSVFWGPYDPSRVYSYKFIGLGDTVRISYLDTNPLDNVGSLDIAISVAPIPLPASLALGVSALAALGVVRRRRGTA